MTPMILSRDRFQVEERELDCLSFTVTIGRINTDGRRNKARPIDEKHPLRVLSILLLFPSSLKEFTSSDSKVVARIMFRAILSAMRSYCPNERPQSGTGEQPRQCAGEVRRIRQDC
jgi:hypothetical protein